MGERITDDILHTLAIVCEKPQDIASAMQTQYGDLLDHWMCTIEMQNADLQKQIINDLLK